MCFKRNFWFSMRCKKRGQQFFCSRCCCCCYTINLVQFIWTILRIFFNPNSFSMKNLTKFCSHRGIKFVSFSSFLHFSSGLLWFRFLNLAMLFNRTHTHTCAIHLHAPNGPPSWNLSVWHTNTFTVCIPNSIAIKKQIWTKCMQTDA